MKPERDILISQSILLPVLGKQQKKATWFKRLSQRLSFCRQQIRTRHQLALLSEEQLRDIGITAAEAELEAKKFFWEE